MDICRQAKSDGCGRGKSQAAQAEVVDGGAPFSK